MTRYQRTMANLAMLLSKAPPSREHHERAVHLPGGLPSDDRTPPIGHTTRRARSTFSLPEHWQRAATTHQPWLARCRQMISTLRGHSTQ